MKRMFVKKLRHNRSVRKPRYVLRMQQGLLHVMEGKHGERIKLFTLTVFEYLHYLEKFSKPQLAH